jgi:hypothetical protein
VNNKPLALLILPFCLAVCTPARDKSPGDSRSENSVHAPTNATKSPVQKPPSAATTNEPASGSPAVEIDLDQDSLHAFKDSKQCRGITVSTTGKSARSDFRVYLRFDVADTPEMEEEWLWTLFDTRHDANGEFRAAGNEKSAPSAVRNVCTEIWQNFNFTKPRQHLQR